eukprot:TRINITY_DN433_c1_g1_i1.p2 TRINITY_DN433_c1_g1~~TRINITY_DN433_c1_g1_i1.p2  ORF type:complete len:629 (+),score=292.12 TRINITY_DN433_c1_g1_i1:129-1889(+)
MAAPPQDPAAKRARVEASAAAAAQAATHVPGSESAWSEMARQAEWMQLQQQRQVEQQEQLARQQQQEARAAREASARERATEAAQLQLEAKKARKAEREARRKEEAEKEKMRQLEEEAEQRAKAIEQSRKLQEAAAEARRREREARAKDQEMDEAPAPGDIDSDELDTDLHKFKSKSALYAHYLKMEKKKLKAEQDLHKRELEKANVINLEKLRHFSPLAAAKMEEEARQRQAEADEKARRREAALSRREKLVEKRKKREEQQRLDHERVLKEMQEKQAKLQEERVAMLAEQLRLDHEARTKAEERESKQMKKLKGSTGPKKDAPLRRVIRDEDKLRQLFGSIPSLPAYGPRRAYCAGELCRMDDERGDGTVLLRFEDGFISWFPKRALIGFEDAEIGDGFGGGIVTRKPDNMCDVCGKVCIPTPAKRSRICGDRETVYRLYVAMWDQGGLPAWNPRNVPNPRRAYCPGSECNIEDEDKLTGKVKLRFDDDFVSWFPSACIQGRKTQDEAEKQKLLPTTTEKLDPFGWNECLPDVEALTKGPNRSGLLSEGAHSTFKVPKNPSAGDFANIAKAQVPTPPALMGTGA